MAGTLDCLGQKPPAAKDMKREDSSEAASAVTLTPAILLQRANQECYTYPVLCSQSAPSSQGGEEAYQNSLSRDMGSQDGLTAPLLMDLSKQAAWEIASRELDKEITNLLRSRESDTILLRQMVRACTTTASIKSFLFHARKQSYVRRPMGGKFSFPSRMLMSSILQFTSLALFMSCGCFLAKDCSSSSSTGVTPGI